MRRKTGIAKVDSYTSALIGSDEAGYGTWAGPLVVVAVCAPKDWDDPEVTDSKQLDDAKRRAIKERYWDDDRFIISPVLVEPEDLDRMGAGKALPWAHTEAVKGCYWRLSHFPLVVIDGTFNISKVDDCEVICVPKGDALVPEVGLASCIAKTLQVDAMRELDQKYPGYGFANHHGYGGNPEHDAALAKLGPCPAHRKSYAPIAKLLAEAERAAQPQSAWEAFDDE